MAGASAAFLDRDGVLVGSVVRDGVPRPAPTAEGLEILPGVVEACRTLKAHGLHLICVTNQPDIARGGTTTELVDAQNAWIGSELGLDAVLVCPHDDVDACSCRKPLPGLLLEGARRFGVDLTHSVMVGDRWRDIEAGQAAGCHTVFIDHHYDERQPVAPDLTVASLLEATPWILEAVSPDRPGMQEQR